MLRLNATYKKKQCSLILLVIMDGWKLLPYIIYKKTLSKGENFLYGTGPGEGWMNQAYASVNKE